MIDKIILVRLKNFVEKHNIIPSEEYRFRSDHSTVAQIIRVVNRIREGFHNKEKAVMVTIDVQKAFDSVWHEGLINKLSKLEISNY